MPRLLLVEWPGRDGHYPAWPWLGANHSGYRPWRPPRRRNSFYFPGRETNKNLIYFDKRPGEISEIIMFYPNFNERLNRKSHIIWTLIVLNKLQGHTTRIFMLKVHVVWLALNKFGLNIMIWEISPGLFRAKTSKGPFTYLCIYKNQVCFGINE